ncbi:hypothetical protein B0A50_01650 [Salinomyces thailandicus]|uniref:Uncharacterized protein n=1 Tax=Salinomyces thailandicus TaxID=706561 RepID=A0A4U0UCV4_9PEZI|nr:hypothetical protein B0A50_01650 [Salinomyces thailandica]
MPPTTTSPFRGREQGQVKFSRGLRVSNTKRLLGNDNSRVDELLDVAKSFNATDVYIYVAPGWYDERKVELVSLISMLHAAGSRAWAVDGDVNYIDDMDVQETFMDGMKALAAFNESVAPHARFFGFQANLEPQDNPGQSGRFHNGVPESRLSTEQHTQRDMILHKWLNLITRASALMRSFEIPFGAVMPWWLHDLEGEPVTVPWGASVVDGSRTCIANLVMPLLDEFVVTTASEDPGIVVRRTRHQARYASNALLEGHAMPRILANRHELISSANHSEDSKQKESASHKAITAVEKTLSTYPAFGGTVIGDWQLAEKAETSSCNSRARDRVSPGEPSRYDREGRLHPRFHPTADSERRASDDRFDAVLHSLQMLKPRK